MRRLPIVVLRKIVYNAPMNNNNNNEFDSAFTNLNEMQREAVKTTDGALLLLAGAGSGKTTVLISRIANLLVNKNVKPHQIIAITFTNKAAGEMKERLERMNVHGASSVWASTFHSACARILRRDIDKLGYDTSFTIYDTADTASLMKRILKDMEISEKDFPHKTVLTYISRAKDEMVSAEKFLRLAESNEDPRRRIIGRAYKEYEKRMKNANALDFDDLILLTVKLFDENPDVLENYQNRFMYVLVDEYQDTNNLQYRLTAALAGGYGNICVVGDDDQSIYKFRGATIENILSFEKQFKNARVIRLEQNYRSTGIILKAANDVIKNNKSRKGKELWTENSEGDKPTLHIVTDERDEAQLVAGEIMASVGNGRKWQDHVILYRMNAQSNQFETAFKKYGIPYRVYGGTGFFERAEIKDMLAYMCVIHNPDDDVRFRRIINNPARGLGDTTIARLSTVAEELEISMFRAIREAHKYENLQSSAPKLIKFADMIEGLREIAARCPLDVLYDELVKATGYVRMLEEKKSDENLSRIENVWELKTNIIAFMNENDGSLFDFLSEMALYTDLDRDDQSSDKVLMMTMHSAKGLEFDTVFLVGAEEGIFPGARVIGDPAEIEEERRLCYVAMTRAMRRLSFTSAKNRMIFGRTTSSMPSRFIGEISSENIEIFDIAQESAWEEPQWGKPRGDKPQGNKPQWAGAYRRDSYSGGSYRGNSYRGDSYRGESRWEKPRRSELAQGAVSAQRPSQGYMPVSKPATVQKPAPQVVYSAGETVRHKTFGNGVIKSVTPAGSDALLEIEFEENGTKRLLQKSATQYLTHS